MKATEVYSWRVDQRLKEALESAARTERTSLATVFTIDRDDFETYRIRGKTRFRIVP
jgi:hypothetical protein